MSAFSIAPFTSIAFGALNFFSARSANRAIEKAARQQMSQIDLQKTRVDVQGILRQNDLAHQGRQAIGQANVAAFAGGRSGASINRAIGQYSSALTASADALEQLRQDAQDQLDSQKEAIARAASNQQVSPFLSAVTGGFQGFNLGSGFDSLVGAKANAESLAKIQGETGLLDQSIGAVQVLLQSRANAQAHAALQEAQSNYDAVTAITGAAESWSAEFERRLGALSQFIDQNPGLFKLLRGSG